MRNVIVLILGVFFGIIMFKSEAASWFRIYEMFQFESFHMYGIIGVAVVLGVIMIQIIKKTGMKSFYGEKIIIHDKDKGIKRYLFGGTIFGLGWALAGACPGPMFTLLGSGYITLAIVILSAIFGTYIYGIIRDKLPH